jgi:hypothetical protein
MPAESSAAVPSRRGPLGWSRKSKILSAVLGAVMAGGAAFAATNWTVGLATGSNGQAQSSTVSNLTIAAIAAPSPTNVLYPGASGDVVAKISNPNGFPVTITGVNLPTNTTYAGGFSDSGLITAQAGCTTSTSLVGWAFATSTSGSAHTLTAPITIAGNGNLTITFTNAATMTTTAPAACQATYFSMPSLTGVVATGGAATATVATTDSWTS